MALSRYTYTHWDIYSSLCIVVKCLGNETTCIYLKELEQKSAAAAGAAARHEAVERCAAVNPVPGSHVEIDHTDNAVSRSK
jgi:hypothetical protein